MKNLHLEFVRLGQERRRLTYRLLNMLPEIYESGIWKKYAGDIYEYAGRYGGIGRSSVEKRLKLEKHLEGKPNLRVAIAKVGVGKVALLVGLATAKNEAMYADKALNMSKSALETLSKELRSKEIKIEFGSEIPQISFCEVKAQKITLELDEEMTFQFLKFKKKFPNLSNKETMRKILEQVEKRHPSPPNSGQKHFEATKAKTSERNPTKIPGDEIFATATFAAEAHVEAMKTKIPENEKPVKKTIPENEKPAISPQSSNKRYISAAQKRATIKNGQCQYPNCNKPYQHLHHPNRFSKTKNHKNLIPLCKDHHEFMHNGLIENETTTTENWHINIYKTPNQSDYQYRKWYGKLK